MKVLIVARSHGQVVKGEDLQSKGHGFESWSKVLDGTLKKMKRMSKPNKYFFFIKKVLFSI